MPSVEQHTRGLAELMLEGLREDYGAEGVRAIATIARAGDLDVQAWARKYEAGLDHTRDLYADMQPAEDSALIESVSLEEAFATALELALEIHDLDA